MEEKTILIAETNKPEVWHVKDTRVTNIISMLLDCDFIIKVNGAKYKFQKKIKK